MSFDPARLYYDGPRGTYLVDAGSYFRTYGRKTPVQTGVARHFLAQGADAAEAKDLASAAIRDAEVDRHVEWSGNLAGHRKGKISSPDGRPMLVLTSPALPQPLPGDAPLIMSLIETAFPDDTQRAVFLGWCRGAFEAVAMGVHQPAPMLCLAGPANSGKSLLAFVVKNLLGGRSANPHNSWSGGLPWNDDLCGAELLLLDDCSGSSDIRSRLNFAAAFKEAVYSGDVSMRKRHASAITCRPVWRVMVCCNDTAESLLVIPPINTDTADKIILLHQSPITPPVDTSHPDGRSAFQRMIRDELPQFAGALLLHDMPAHLSDSRGGVLAWRHPDLVLALDSTRPEIRLEELLVSAMETSAFDDLPRIMTASEVESRLMDPAAGVRDQARQLFYYPAACGTYLGRLADSGSEIVKPAEKDAKRKIRRFYLRRSIGG